jgi:hypothetical protein
MATEKGVIRIRFASGERSFSLDFSGPHLTVTTAAPAKAAPAKSKARSKKA